MSKKIGREKARGSAGILGLRGFLAPFFKNSFFGIFGVKSGKKGVFGTNFCKSLKEKNDV